ncbi:MAG: hypothetical protein ORN56_00040 [Chitinophagales bacterium]|jgi:hypothetical protein|nr:hypothetical protein [Chitinophagales bacterium]
MEEHISINRNQVLGRILGATVFVALGIWLFFFTPATENLWIKNPLIVKAIGAAAVLFFGYAGFVLLKQLSNKNNGLILSKEGITDHSGAVNAGLIAWKDIKSVKQIEVSKTPFLILFVNNPDEYIERQQSKFQKKLLKMNLNTYGSPICISAVNLDISISKLQEKIETRIK